MIVIRNTFQVNFGKMKEAVPLLKENMARAVAAGGKPGRLMTDVTGAFYTLVLELEFDDMADADRNMNTIGKLPGWQETYQKFCAVVDSGRREIFSVVG